MKKLIYSLLCIIAAFTAHAQTYTPHLFAGTGTSLGDGGPATSASLNSPQGICCDGAGNIYIADSGNYRIRKIDALGIITTICGTGISGYSGDGGAAISATISGVLGMCTDNAGNVYFTDKRNARVRKINTTTGIITTIAGNGTLLFTDSVLATSTGISTDLCGVCADAGNNIYINTLNGIYRVDATTGIIRNWARIGDVTSMTIDGAGNLYAYSDGGNVYKVNTVGDTTTFYHPSGMVVTAVQTDVFGNLIVADVVGGYKKVDAITGAVSDITIGANLPDYICTDATGNLYFSGMFTHATIVYKLSISVYALDDSMGIYIDNQCSGPQFTIGTRHYSAGTTICSDYGDGSRDTVAVTTGTGSYAGVARFAHSYLYSGTYTVRQVLMHGGMSVDSLTYSYTYAMCTTLSEQFYYDANSNCIFDSGDSHLLAGVLTEIDSNGVAVDTVSSTSGFYYNAYGTPGDVYTLRNLSVPAGMVASCPASGIVYDTLATGVYSAATNYMALNCTAASSFDLVIRPITCTGTGDAIAAIDAYNLYCTPESATVTLNFSPKYAFDMAWPAPASVTGNTVTWNVGTLSAALAYPASMWAHFEVPDTLLTIGDTVQFSGSVTPVAGDADTANNSFSRVDTIRSSWDPNEMSVAPQGIITAGRMLQYGIEFENTGNDTAHNIYVMDTLSANVNVSSLRVLSSSAAMNISILHAGTYTIARFDFPHINLLDSSHHGQCTGMVTFNINAKTGLPVGTTIFNHAGIFFDGNPVVMTNTVEDIIGTPTAVKPVATAAAAIKIYPSPAASTITIQADNTAYSSFTISSTIGNIVMAKDLTAAKTTVDIQQLPAGVYYITVQGACGVKVQQFVKE